MATPLKTRLAPDHAAGSSPEGQSAIPSPKSKIERVLAYRWLWAFAILAFALDQLTKIWINARLPLGSYGYGARGGIQVFRGFFYIVHVGNTGAAWSMFSGKSTVLALLALGTLLAIFIWRKQLGLRQTAAQVCFGLLCGGTVGNLVDRLIHGHVIDFLDFHFGDYIYPTFNVADAAICVGVFGYIIWSMKQPDRPEPAGSNK